MLLNRGLGKFLEVGGFSERKSREGGDMEKWKIRRLWFMGDILEF